MEADALSPVELGLLLLPFVVMLLAALCVRCRELPGKWGALGKRDAGHSIESSCRPRPFTLQLSLLQSWVGVGDLRVPDPASLAVSPLASYDSASTER